MLYITATLRTKKDRSNYYVCIRYKNKEGKPDAKWVTTNIPVKGNNIRKAEAEKNKIFLHFNLHQIELSDNTPFCSFINNWLENIKPAISPVTYDSYSMIVNNHIIPFFEPLNLKISAVAPAHIQMYINKKLQNISPNTVRKHLFNLSKCFDSAI